RRPSPRSSDEWVASRQTKRSATDSYTFDFSASCESRASRSKFSGDSDPLSGGGAGLVVALRTTPACGRISARVVIRAAFQLPRTRKRLPSGKVRRMVTRESPPGQEDAAEFRHDLVDAANGLGRP